MDDPQAPAPHVVRALALAEAGLYGAIVFGVIALFFIAFYVTARFHR